MIFGAIWPNFPPFVISPSLATLGVMRETMPA
jgi:hypothetical protein